MSNTFASSVGTVDRVLAAQVKQIFGDSIVDDLEASDISAVPTSRTINGYDLTANRSLSASDVGAPASNITGISGAAAITNIVSISQANYDALSPKSATTLYVIV